MRGTSINFAFKYSRLLVILGVLTLLLLVGGVGEVAAHGPCHSNPGNVPEAVCNDLPSQEAPRG